MLADIGGSGSGFVVVTRRGGWGDTDSKIGIAEPARCHGELRQDQALTLDTERACEVVKILNVSKIIFL